MSNIAKENIIGIAKIDVAAYCKDVNTKVGSTNNFIYTELNKSNKNLIDFLD